MTDDLLPLQNTLASQSVEAVPDKGAEATGTAQQTLAEKMQDAATGSSPAVEPVDSEVAVDGKTTAVAAAESADAGVALVTGKGPASEGKPSHPNLLLSIVALQQVCI